MREEIMFNNLLTDDDRGGLVNLFIDRGNETVHSLFTIQDTGAPVRICGLFRKNKSFIIKESEKYVRFRTEQIISEMDFCKKNKYGYFIIHNHPAGYNLSRSDVASRDTLLIHTKTIGLELLYFAIIDMATKRIRILRYSLNNGYKEEEYIC